LAGMRFGGQFAEFDLFGQLAQESLEGGRERLPSKILSAGNSTAFPRV
jgi:hypothetical protein